MTDALETVLYCLFRTIGGALNMALILTFSPIGMLAGFAGLIHWIFW